MANDWQARGVELIIIMFYVKNMTPRNPLKIVNKIGQMMKQLWPQIATTTYLNMNVTRRKT